MDGFGEVTTHIVRAVSDDWPIEEGVTSSAECSEYSGFIGSSVWAMKTKNVYLMRYLKSHLSIWEFSNAQGSQLWDDDVPELVLSPSGAPACFAPALIELGTISAAEGVCAPRHSYH